MKTKLFALLGAVAVTLVVGCGGPKKPADLPELYPVKITVIQDGQPLEGASVMLNDPSLKIRFVMGGTTNAQGVAEIKTDAQFPGAPEGEFKITIRKATEPESSGEMAPTDPAERAEWEKKQAELMNQTADTVDLKFGDMAQTPATIKVVPGGAEATVDVGEKVNIPFSESRKSSS